MRKHPCNFHRRKVCIQQIDFLSFKIQETLKYRYDETFAVRVWGGHIMEELSDQGGIGHLIKHLFAKHHV